MPLSLSPPQNSIRHNLSLHNRFMRVQNEGTGKSSWWMINPDADQFKSGKNSRRNRASTALEASGAAGARGPEFKRRGRNKKNATTTSSTGAHGGLMSLGGGGRGGAGAPVLPHLLGGPHHLHHHHHHAHAQDLLHSPVGAGGASVNELYGEAMAQFPFDLRQPSSNGPGSRMSPGMRQSHQDYGGPYPEWSPAAAASEFGGPQGYFPGNYSSCTMLSKWALIDDDGLLLLGGLPVRGGFCDPAAGDFPRSLSPLQLPGSRAAANGFGRFPQHHEFMQFPSPDHHQHANPMMQHQQHCILQDGQAYANLQVRTSALTED
jgi:hypothetical protein